jgi:hypothetical protein
MEPTCGNTSAATYSGGRRTNCISGCRAFSFGTMRSNSASASAMSVQVGRCGPCTSSGDDDR